MKVSKLNMAPSNLTPAGVEEYFKSLTDIIEIRGDYIMSAEMCLNDFVTKISNLREAINDAKSGVETEEGSNLCKVLGELEKFFYEIDKKIDSFLASQKEYENKLLKIVVEGEGTVQ